VRAVVAELQRAAAASPIHAPLLILADQEGGEVRRLSGAPELSERAIGEGSDPVQLAAEAGAGAAQNLAGVGANVNLSPVLDVLRGQDDFIDQFHRSYGSDPAQDGQLGAAFIAAQQRLGVAATAKHFPGLGLAGGNTDNGQITIKASAAKIKKGFPPFAAAVKAGVKLVMVSTAIYPHLDASRKPAAFSSKIVNGLLRKQLGFQGVTVTDSLTAPAASATPHAAKKAMLAGSDLLIWGSESASEAGYSTLVADAPGSHRLQARLAQAAGRIRALKAWLTAQGGPACSP
jgi:beta-N-acetylhexosaminidase